MRTSTSEIVDQVITYAVVLTRVGITIINIDVTIFPLITWWTITLVCSNQIFASSTILARIS